MLADKQSLICREIVEGTGADIDIKVLSSGLQTGLRIWFSDLGRTKSPIIDLKPYGLKRHRVVLSFGDYAAATASQMQNAGEEEKQLARALVRSVHQFADLTLSDDQSLGSWVVNGPQFRIIAERKNIENPLGDDALISTCHEVVTPLLAAMAEIYGYDIVEETVPDNSDPIMEGAVRVTSVRRRERNPRSRLLSLRIHGEVCAICEADPLQMYGEAGSIIEVHHLQPLSLTDGPRAYDPATDLIPLCPNCHRAIHTRRPVPWTPDELAQRLHDSE